MSTHEPIGEMKVSFREMPDPISEPLPLKLLVLSEFQFQEDGRDVSDKTKDRISVDKERFGDVINRLVGSISLTVQNCLSDHPKALLIQIPITSIKSFHPDALIEAIPPLKTLSGIRGLVNQVIQGTLSLEDCRRELVALPGGEAILARLQQGNKAQASGVEDVPASSTPLTPSEVSSPTTPQNLDIDSLLEMVDVPDSSSTRPAFSPESVLPKVDELISQVLGSDSDTPGLNRTAAQAVLTDLDHTLAEQLDAILHHAEFQRLESVWRGLKFLFDRTNFRDPIQIDLLHVSKQNLASHFEELVVQPELSGHAVVPLTAILANYTFDRSSQDLDLLNFLAHQAERLQVPIVSSVGLPFLGTESYEELRRCDAVGQLFDSVELVKWRALREGSASRWLVLTFNRFLLRFPYVSTHPIQAFPFQEAVSSEDGYLWGNPIWALSSVLTGSFSRSGWCTQLVGLRGGGLIEDLPIRDVKIVGIEGEVFSLECLLADAQREDLSQLGILALTSRPQSDSAMVLSAPTVHLPEVYADATVTEQARIQSTLSYQLLAARIAHQVNQACGGIGTSVTHQSFQGELSRTLSHVFGLPPSDSRQAIVVKEEEPVEKTSDSPVTVTVYPDRLGLGNFPPVQLSVPVPN